MELRRKQTKAEEWLVIAQFQREREKEQHEMEMFCLCAQYPSGSGTVIGVSAQAPAVVPNAVTNRTS
jgi:hypothetical protein